MPCTTPNIFHDITFSEYPFLKESKRPNLAAEHTNPLSSSLKVLRRCLARDVCVCEVERGKGGGGEKLYCNVTHAMMGVVAVGLRLLPSMALIHLNADSSEKLNKYYKRTCCKSSPKYFEPLSECA